MGTAARFKIRAPYGDNWAEWVERHQLQSATALFAGFLGAYAWSIRHFAREIEAGRLSSYSFLVATANSLLSLQWIDGLNYASRRRLFLQGIYNVQNLAMADPLLLTVATTYQLHEIIDWIGQARMVLRVKDRHRLEMLGRRSVHTIFDLVAAAQDRESATELGLILKSPPLQLSNAGRSCLQAPRCYSTRCRHSS